MRFKLAARCLLFAGLCVYLTSVDMLLKEGLAVQNSRIVFMSTRDGNYEIYVMDADGGNQENLTNHPATDTQPDWSPDGTKIAFASGRDGRRSHQIYVMDADGKNPIKLTDGPLTKSHPDWSPDGRKIAFTVRNLWTYQIDVMDADGNNREKLVAPAAEPSWSPDGRKIAFIARGAWSGEMHVIGADGQGLKRVTHDLTDDWNPSFSPDGRRIAYMMSKVRAHAQIYVVGRDGKNRVRLTYNKEHHGFPAWSPDGRIIAYHVVDGKCPDQPSIHLMTADGKYLRQLSDDRKARDWAPDISPLGLAVSPASKTTTIWGKLKKRARDLR